MPEPMGSSVQGAASGGQAEPAGPPPWIARLLEGAPAGVERLEPCHDIESLKVTPEGLIPLCQRVKADGFSMCLDVAGVDYLPREPRFEVVYHFLALKGDGTPEKPRRLQLRVPVQGERPEVPTVSGMWPSANWAEREIYDLLGIRFTGHPDLRRILMPDDWEGHPLRKDYPLRGPRALEEEELPAGQQFDFLQARARPHRDGGR